MIKTSVYIIVYFCMLCQFTSCQQKDNGLLWEISGNGLDNPSFIAVGALHLCGETGHINQLRKMGYIEKPMG